jgi:hypothetical protein
VSDVARVVPAAIKFGHPLACVVLAAFRFYRAPTTLLAVEALVLWLLVAALFWWMMLKQRNWARIALGVWTFPAGLVLFLSKEARCFTRPGEPVSSASLFKL